MHDDVSGESDYTANDAAVLQNVFAGKGATFDEAMADAAGHALRKHPQGTPFEISRMWAEIHNPRVSEYRVVLTKSTPPL